MPQPDAGSARSGQAGANIANSTALARVKGNGKT